jgi:hypothetical protein
LAVNVLFIILALLLSNLRNYQLFLILIFAAAMVSSIPYLLVKRKRKRLATEQTTT